MGGRARARTGVWILVWTNAAVKGYRGYGRDASRSAPAYGTVE